MQQFDPYQKWFGIKSEEQPPNHYRLLGVDLFESDDDVIQAAAEQRMTFLRNVSTGPRTKLAQQILNEVMAAQICLLDVERSLSTTPIWQQQLRRIAIRLRRFGLPRASFPSC